MGCNMIFSNISAISATKGIDIYIEAALGSELNSSFHIVGKARDVEYAFEVAMRQKVEDSGHQNIQFFGYQNNVIEYLESIDVVVLTSVVEDALPTVLIEAISQGKIIIASDVGGVREIVPAGCGNIIIPKGDVQELKKAIHTVTNYDASIVETTSKMNRAHFAEKFIFENQIHALEKVYKGVL
ncbi:glycosyltransferase family 4 protein [Vibrio panuliri]|uniref:Glycosyl transferase family 1 domain-containing protein n=2 Tax=Vibrio panuliri TaxID=1381081 RepID=A0ABX3FI87_9VIBR|nr:glycosyltransferase family 4 protein [Vibrio panuliri]OLQ93881.1 hypothetical protein BIY20_08040 [Vibrio panuliri]